MRASTRFVVSILALSPLLCPLGGCQSGSGAPPSPTAAASAAPAVSASVEPLGEASATPQREIVGASQILVAYRGAELAGPTVTRSKADAKKRAEEALEKLKDGKASFEDLAKQYSDDATKAIGGAIGNFERDAMPPAFSDAAFALKVGDTSGVVETARGFHIIRRTR